MARYQWYLDPLSTLIINKNENKKKALSELDLLTKLSGSAHAVQHLIRVYKT